MRDIKIADNEKFSRQNIILNDISDKLKKFNNSIVEINQINRKRYIKYGSNLLTHFNVNTSLLK